MKRLEGYIEDHRRGSKVELVNTKRAGKGFPLHVEVQELVKAGQKVKAVAVQKLTIPPGKQVIKHLEPQFRVKAWYEWPPEIFTRRGLRPKKTQIYEGYEEGTFREEVPSRHRRPFDGFSSRYFKKQAQLTKEQYYNLVVKRQAIPQALWKHSYKLYDTKAKEEARRAKARRAKEAAAEKKRKAAAEKKRKAAAKKKKEQKKKKAAAHEKRIRKAEEYSRKGKFKQGARYAMNEAKKAEARGDNRHAQELWKLSRSLQAEVAYAKPRGKKAKVAGARCGQGRHPMLTKKGTWRKRTGARYPEIETAIYGWINEHTPDTRVASLELLYYDLASHLKVKQTPAFEEKVRKAMQSLVRRGAATAVDKRKMPGVYRVT